MPLTRIQTDALASAITSSNIADGGIQTVDIANNAITTAKIANGAIIPADMANGGAEFGMRNRIINGDMRIDQRNNGASATIGPSTSTDFRVDRFFIQRFGGTAVFSANRSSTAPAGFTNSLNINVTTAAAPSTSTDSAFIRHLIEGFNVADLDWGTVTAQPVTLSFWVRSSVTGNYAGGVTNGAPDRSYVFTYTVSQANTWEYKTVTIPGDTTGTWAKDNTAGMRINFDLGSGTAFNGTAGTWAAGNAFRTSSTGTFMNNSGAAFFITGIQLEAGSVATPFERRPFGLELHLCQRYFQIVNQPQHRFFTSTTATSGFTISNETIPVAMRATPSITYSSSATLVNISANTTAVVNMSFEGTSANSYRFYPVSGVSTSVIYVLTGLGSIPLSAEL